MSLARGGSLPQDPAMPIYEAYKARVLANGGILLNATTPALIEQNYLAIIRHALTVVPSDQKIWLPAFILNPETPNTYTKWYGLRMSDAGIGATSDLSQGSLTSQPLATSLSPDFTKIGAARLDAAQTSGVISANTTVTLSFWIRSDSAASVQAIMVYGGTTTTPATSEWRIRDIGARTLNIHTSAGSYTFGGQYPTGWCHIVLSFVNNAARLWINGTYHSQIAISRATSTRTGVSVGARSSSDALKAELSYLRTHHSYLATSSTYPSEVYNLERAYFGV